MANNRMVLTCLHCVGRPETKPEDCFLWILKYYPSSGWYICRDEAGTERFGSELNEWLDKHKHGDLLGEYILLLPERLISDRAQAATDILQAFTGFVVEAVARGKARGKES